MTPSRGIFYIYYFRHLFQVDVFYHSQYVPISVYYIQHYFHSTFFYHSTLCPNQCLLYLTLFPINVFYFSMLCPIRRSIDLRSYFLSSLFTIQIFVLSTYFTIQRFSCLRFVRQCFFTVSVFSLIFWRWININIEVVTENWKSIAVEVLSYA
jgi:hypothetical protein